MRICRTRFSSARTTSGTDPSASKRNASPFSAACSSNRSAISCTKSAKRIGFDVQRELAGLDAGDVQRAFDQRQQVLAAALDDGHRVLAVRRHRRSSPISCA
jgi:hypothetical protein